MLPDYPFLCAAFFNAPSCMYLYIVLLLSNHSNVFDFCMWTNPIQHLTVSSRLWCLEPNSKKNPRTWSILHYIPKTGERKEKSPKSRSWPEERSSRVRHLWGYIRPQESVFTFEVILLQHSTPPWHIVLGQD